DDRIAPAAGGAAQPGAVRGGRHLGPARGTREDFEQFRIDRQGTSGATALIAPAEKSCQTERRGGAGDPAAEPDRPANIPPLMERPVAPLRPQDRIVVVR